MKCLWNSRTKLLLNMVGFSLIFALSHAIAQNAPTLVGFGHYAPTRQARAVPGQRDK